MLGPVGSNDWRRLGNPPLDVSPGLSLQENKLVSQVGQASMCVIAHGKSPIVLPPQPIHHRTELIQRRLHVVHDFLGQNVEVVESLQRFSCALLQAWQPLHSPISAYENNK
jgi:hypothetical protein